MLPAQISSVGSTCIVCKKVAPEEAKKRSGALRMDRRIRLNTRNEMGNGCESCFVGMAVCRVRRRCDNQRNQTQRPQARPAVALSRRGDGRFREAGRIHKTLEALERRQDAVPGLRVRMRPWMLDGSLRSVAGARLVAGQIGRRRE